MSSLRVYRGLMFWGFLVLLAAFAARPVCAAARLETVTVAYSTVSGSYAPLWMAAEDGLGVKQGLDLRVIYAGRVRPQQLLASGEVPFVLATGTGALSSHILGIKDQVIVATITNRTGASLFAKPEIKNYEDLKGRTIATGRPGAFQDVITRYVLRAKLGLIPDRDVKLLPTGEPALAVQALEHGVVDAAGMSEPFPFIARKMGFRELVNYDKLGITYPYTTVTVLRTTLNKNPELTDKLLRTLIEGTYLFKTNKERALAVLRKYMRGTNEEILAATYQNTVASIEEVPQPSLAAIKTALEMLAPQYPQAKTPDANAIIDPSFVKRIEDSGFIRALYKK